VLTIPLANAGENSFRLRAFGVDGAVLRLPEEQIAITRTAAAVDAIPASHSISVEALNRVGGAPVAVALVRKGDPLPKKGNARFKAERALASGSPGALNFKLWEGEILDPVTDNNFIGAFEIQGHQLAEGVVPAGADLICEYEVEDSGHIHLEVSIPAVGGSFHSQGNLYSRQAAAVDYSNAAPVVLEEAAQTSDRLEEVSRRIGDDEAVENLRSKLESISNIDPDESDAEATKEAMDEIQAVKRELAEIRRRHMRAIREMDLERLTEFFDNIRHLAKPVEASAFDNLARTARRLIDDPSGEFEAYLDEMRAKNFDVLWRQDAWVIERFNYNLEHPHLFRDQSKFESLTDAGRKAITAGDMDALRQAVLHLDSIRIMGGKDEDITVPSNIVVS
jgi:molecular chaperone DnaK